MEANIYIMLGGVALFIVTITLLDFLGRRQRRKAHKQ